MSFRGHWWVNRYSREKAVKLVLLPVVSSTNLAHAEANQLVKDRLVLDYLSVAGLCLLLLLGIALYLLLSEPFTQHNFEDKLWLWEACA